MVSVRYVCVGSPVDHVHPTLQSEAIQGGGQAASCFVKQLGFGIRSPCLPQPRGRLRATSCGKLSRSCDTVSCDACRLVMFLDPNVRIVRNAQEDDPSVPYRRVMCGFPLKSAYRPERTPTPIVVVLLNRGIVRDDNVPCLLYCNLAFYSYWMLSSQLTSGGAYLHTSK